MRFDSREVVRTDLPDPEVVIVRYANGDLEVVADTTLSDEAIRAALAGFDPHPGTGHALS